MRLEDYERKIFEDFKGFFWSGQPDEVPEEFFTNCLNVDYTDGEVFTRPGLDTAITLGYGGGNGKVRRFAAFADPAFGYIVLILNEVGALYTFSTRAGDTATTPRLTVFGSTDFSAIRMYGRIFISFHNGQSGLNTVPLFVYTPHPTNIALDEFRDAAGFAPAGTAMAASDGGPGIVNAGTYKIAVSYITNSGFVTKPGPIVLGVFTPTVYNAPGGLTINLSNIPIGPVGTAHRQILITKADLEEYFFLPQSFGGLIPGNVSTSTILNFDDTTDLVDSADYLFDLLESVPGPLALHSYNARLCIAGEFAQGSIVRVSRKREPESFSAIDGIVHVNKDDGFTIRNLLVMRDVLYVWKNLGVHAVQDNGDEPSGWQVYPIDENVNVSIHGIGEFFDNSEIKVAREWTVIADRSGLLLFDGSVRKKPITHNIDNIWQLINFNVYHKITVVVDDHHHKIYCALPIPNDYEGAPATDNTYLIMGDYNECPSNVPQFDTIKWSAWRFKPGISGTLKGATEIGMFGVNPDTVPTLKIGSIDGGGKIWRLNPAATTDDGGVIENWFETAFLYWDSGMIHFFNAVRMRITGTGLMSIIVYGEDYMSSLTVPSPLTLQTFPGREFLVRFNFQNEKASIRFEFSGRFILSKLEVHGKPIYQMRPA